MNIKNHQKGVVLYMIVVMMSILLAVVFGLSTSIIGGLNLIVMIENSIKSFHAADAGVEKALYNINSGNCVGFSGSFENEYGGSYDVTINYDGTGEYDGVISSLGSYDQARKKVKQIYVLPNPFPLVDFSCGDSFIDCRDGNLYNTASFGSQCWMTKNLAYLPSVTGDEVGSTGDPYYYVYGYEGTDVATAKSLPNDVYNIYGVLYNYPAAITACPFGWHLPTDNEWKILEMQLGMTEEEADKIMVYRGVDEGTDLQEGVFQAKMAGNRSIGGGFYAITQQGYFWSSTESLGRGLSDGHPQVYRNNYSKEYGFSARCVRD